MLLLGPLGLAACASPRAVPPKAAAPVPLQMDGVVVRAEPDPLTQLSIYDAEQLFHIAREMTRNERPLDAIRVYEALLTDFGHSRLVQPALYNLGLLYEGTGDFKAAADSYFTVTSEPLPDDQEARRTWLDSHYRLAVCFGKLEAWWRAVAIFDALLKLEGLADEDRLEAYLGRAVSLQEAGEPDAAEVAFATVLRFAREAERRGPLADGGMIAEAAFRLGVIADERYQAVVLEFPVPLLRDRLEEKCGFLLQAQYRYMRAIRRGDAHTVAAAGYRIGHLYESLYDLITTLQPPAELTAEQDEVYREEVRQRVNILVEKALRIYEQALVVGATSATAEEWNARLRKAIERLRDLYLSQDEVSLGRR